MALTKKQEIFCQEVFKQDSQSDAYRIAYNTKNMTDKQIHEEASKLIRTPKVSQRIEDLRSKMEKKALYTIEQSVKRDIKLIERYESALDVLENDKSSKTELEAAERTIKHIGSSAYNSAQDRLSKQHGFFEKDNSQNKPTIVNHINLGEGEKPKSE